MLLCPDALMLNSEDYYTVATTMLGHCAKVQRRVALFDVYGGAATAATGKTASPGQPVTLADTNSFREKIGENNLSYGIAYFPWMNTAVVSASDSSLSFDNFTPNALKTVQGLLPAAPTPAPAVTAASLFDKASAFALPAAPSAADLATAAQQAADKLALHNRLKANSPAYGQALQAIATYLSRLPVAPAMAGVYTAVDGQRGVWKAPANVSLNAVVSPTLAVSDDMQAGLNVDALTGKSIHVIRAFKGLGTLVWGARTLDGNSQDWRYVNVRRTIIMIEQSLKLAARSTVFEPNDANTWVTFKSMVESFLHNLWKQGALAGAPPPRGLPSEGGPGQYHGWQRRARRHYAGERAAGPGAPGRVYRGHFPAANADFVVSSWLHSHSSPIFSLLAWQTTAAPKAPISGPSPNFIFERQQ